jgi:HSP20 family protein
MAEKNVPTKQPAMWPGTSFGDFRKQMDDLVENFFGRPFGVRAGGDITFPNGNGMISPAIDVSENDKTITLTAELPGMEEKDVDLSVRDGVMTLKGEKRYEHKEEKEDTHVMERRYGSFQRMMTLPDSVDQGRIQAKFDKGVLTVTMPKTAEAKSKARKIDIGK